MYHAAETGNVEQTIDLRNMGVPWTIYNWVQTLKCAYEGQLLNIVNELLQDFSVTWLDESRELFVDDGLDLLFSLFRTSAKAESTLLLLADIFSSCFTATTSDNNEQDLEVAAAAPTKHKIELHVPSSSSSSLLAEGGSGSRILGRIDPKFINSPELSDVQFKVEGRIFYAHKLILVTASSRFQSMLNSRLGEGSPPMLQINDIRYDIFELIMKYLYNGSAQLLNVDNGDILELMAAANFFQLSALLQHCEATSAKLVDLDNVVSFYIHAKVYSAKRLLNYCERFMLRNLVALLTYDDSVKRLLLGKKSHSQDVLIGLRELLRTELKKPRE